MRSWPVSSRGFARAWSSSNSSCPTTLGAAAFPLTWAPVPPTTGRSPQLLIGTAAASWLTTGHSLIFVARQLGHRSITTTEQHYGHLELNLFTNALAATDNAITRAGLAQAIKFSDDPPQPGHLVGQPLHETGAKARHRNLPHEPFR